MNQAFWDGLSEDEKYVVSYAARSAIVAGRGMSRIIEPSERGLPALAKDLEVNSLDPAAKRQFRDAAMPPVKKLFTEKFGPEGVAMMNAFLSAIEAAK